MLNTKHVMTCAMIVLVAMTAGCERRSLMQEAERQLDAAEERIAEIGDVYTTGHEQQLVRLGRAPDCAPNAYYCNQSLESAQETAEVLREWMLAYTGEETQNLLAEIRVHISVAETVQLRRFREPAEDATSRWRRLFRFNSTVRIERAGTRAGDGWAGMAAMAGTGLLNALADLGGADYDRISMEVDDARARVLRSSQAIQRDLREARRIANSTG